MKCQVPEKAEEDEVRTQGGAVGTGHRVFKPGRKEDVLREGRLKV